jgi:hypothetical protein
VRRAAVGAGLFLALAAAALAAAPPAPPDGPAPPAFCTGGVSRIGAIRGDTFSFECEGGKRLKVRLHEASCDGLGASAIGSATAIVADLLETEPVWIFPCGVAKGAEGEELYAQVWTSKGWLGETLIRAGYAQRRNLEGVTLAPFDPAGTRQTGPRPAAPAFSSTSCTAVEGGVFEVDSAGAKFRVRLFDVEVDPPSADAARGAAGRAIGADPVWVFPCAPHKSGQDWPVRIWTKEGALSEVLVKAGAAKRLADPDKALAAASATPSPSTPAGTTAGGGPPGPSPRPTKPGPPASKAGTQEIKWRAISVSTAHSRTKSCMSNRFQIDAPLFRITWDFTPWRTNSPVSFTISRVETNVVGGGTSRVVTSFVGLQGCQIVRCTPGTFWMQVLGSPQCTVKVEVPE